MTAHTGGKRPFWRKAGGWLFGVAARPGRARWIFLSVVVLLFLTAVLLLGDRIDYRRDPSALVPPSARIYVETPNLGRIIQNAGAWRLWQAARRRATEQYNQLHVDIAGLLGERVNGLGTRLLRHLAVTERAAYCTIAEDGTGAAWALFMQFPEPASALAEISAEQSLNIETIKSGVNGDRVLRLADNAGGQLFFGVVKPWFIVSSTEFLPVFALDGAGRKNPSLATSGILPKWKRNTALRGVYDPSSLSGRTGLPVLDIVSGWTAPEMRVNFTASLKNGLEAAFNTAALTDRSGDGAFWPLAWFLLLLLALVSLALIAGTVLLMIGWGGWLKASALRAGIVPADGPAEVEPSPAFREDAGLDECPGPDAEEPGEDKAGGEATPEPEPESWPEAADCPEPEDVEPETIPADAEVVPGTGDGKEAGEPPNPSRPE